VIYFSNQVRRSGVDARRLKRVAAELLAALDEAESTLSLTLTGDERIRALNREHRAKDRATDVLSFPMGEPAGPERLLGDVVISVDTARRQAAEYDAPLQNEIYRLLIHGLLHLLGHDHERPVERARMEAEERRLAGAIGMPWPYDDA
jgi:probable rRNA maturation factor